jgi:hypothetical protein
LSTHRKSRSAQLLLELLFFHKDLNAAEIERWKTCANGDRVPAVVVFFGLFALQAKFGCPVVHRKCRSAKNLLEFLLLRKYLDAAGIGRWKTCHSGYIFYAETC